MPAAPKPKPRIYLAAPLFALHERQWNRQLAERLEAMLRCSVLLPQDFEPAEPDEAARHRALFRLCIDGIDQCDAVLAILDGPDADSGTAFEMGYAYAIGKPLVAIRTDYRPQHDQGSNLMLTRACSAFLHLVEPTADVDGVAAAITRKLTAVLEKR